MRLSGTVRQKIGVAVAATAGSFVGSSVYGIIMSVVIVPISRDLGWSRSEISGISPLISPIVLVWQILFGRLADRFGIRWVLIGANLAYACSLFSISFSPHNILVFYLLITLTTLSGVILGQQLFMTAIAGWFDRRRGTVMAMMSFAGVGLGRMVLPVVVAVLLTTFGWRGAYQGSAVLVILIGFPTMVFLLKNPPKTGQATAISSFGRGVGETLRSHVYWILLLATTLGAGCMVAATERIVPALTDRGFPLSLAVSVLAIIPLVGGFAGVFVGWLLDRTLIPWAAAPLYGAAIVGMLLIEYGHGQVAMLAGGVFLGVGVGAEFAILPLLVSRYFGVRNYAGIISITYAAISLSTSLFPFLMDKTFDASGSYAKAFDYMAIALLIGAALIVFLPRLKHPGIGTSRSTGAALALDGLENRALSD